MKVLLHGLGVMTVVLLATGKVYAGIAPAVPEIGGGSIAAALGLLSAGIMVMRARRRK